MNKTLQALMTKLQWQLTDLDNQLHALDQQLDHLELLMSDNQKKIDNACETPAFIVPEKEIARLNFIITESQRQDSLSLSKTELLSQKDRLATRKVRLNIELKMLEKHQSNQQGNERLKGIAAEQKNADEWALQQKEPA